jgi:drug/metabolite transporter (DMT)-like permease
MRLGAIGAALVAVTLWGGTPIATRLAVAELEPTLVAILRTVLAGVLVAPLAMIEWRRLGRPISGPEWRLMAVSGLGGFVFFPLFFTYGTARTSGAHAGLVLALLPVTTGLIGAWVQGSGLSGRWWLGVVVAGAGEAVLIGGGTHAGAASAAGDAIILGSCALASAGYVAGGRLAATMGAWRATLFSLVMASLAFLPLLAVQPVGTALPAVGPSGWLGIAYLAFASSVVGYALWYWALSAGEISRAGLYQFFQPIFSVLLAVLILDESLDLGLVVAAGMILLGVVIARSLAR